MSVENCQNPVGSVKKPSDIENALITLGDSVSFAKANFSALRMTLSPVITEYPKTDSDLAKLEGKVISPLAQQIEKLNREVRVLGDLILETQSEVQL